MARRVRAWHFLPETYRTRFSNEPVTAGTVLRVRPPLGLCQRGLHGSRRVLDALNSAPGPILCRTEHRGTIVEGHDKLCSSVREVLWTLDARWHLLEFAMNAYGRGGRPDASERLKLCLRSEGGYAGGAAHAWAHAWALDAYVCSGRDPSLNDLMEDLVTRDETEFVRVHEVEV